MSGTDRYAEVILPLPISRAYTYLIPDALGDRVVPGARVVVPVQRRELVGIVSVVAAAPPASAAKSVVLAPDPEPAVTPELMKLAAWLARYYGAPIGLAMRAALPGSLWGASRLVAVRTEAGRRADGVGAGGEVLRLFGAGDRLAAAAIAKRLRRPAWETLRHMERAGLIRWEVAPARLEAPPAVERVIVLTQSLSSLLERERVFKRSPKRRAAYEAIEALGGRASVPHLVRQLQLSPAVLEGLARQRLARFEQVAQPRDPFAGLSSPPPPNLTEEQRRVVEAIAATPPEIPVLIHGVTGSGKTLVYLEVLRRLVTAGQGAILLVPEIALTPQMVARVRGVFGDQVAVLHSALSDGERADAWRALRRGERRVAVGPRSAVFAPIPRLGAIVVDEEHEPSYKQGTAPRYHARDVALVRARLEGARVVLGSATPSLETLHLAATGQVRTLELPERIGARPLPPVEVIDLRSAPRVTAPEARGVPWSEALDGAVREALSRGEQVILLLNRRGFATFLQCPSCGAVAECPRCAIALTVHQTPAPPALRCHYCGHAEPVPGGCLVCGHATQRMRGLGTQQLEHFLELRFPAARIARMDLDTTSTKWSHHRILERVARREVDILVGTQMIAKGLDFPAVTVVGVVDADTALHLPDFRAAERTFQLVAQVAGRAGRGPRGGRVYVQTRAPAHHAIRAAAAHSVREFAAAELPLRAPPHPAYPPHVGLARFVASGGEPARAQEAAERVAAWLRRANAERLGGALTVLGPAPCPITRLKGRWRWHVLVKAAEPRLIGRVVRAWQGRARGAVVVDRDPVSLL